MQFIAVFFDTAKVADFWWKGPEVSKTQWVCHVIYMFFLSSLGKV